MSQLDVMLGTGILELIPEELPTISVDEGDIGEQIGILIAEKADAEAVAADAVAVVESDVKTLDTIEVIRGSMESLLTADNISPATVANLAMMANNAITQAGFDSELTQSGMEDFDNEALIGQLNAGIEALHKAEGNIFQRLGYKIQAGSQALQAAMQKHLTLAGTLKKSVNGLIGDMTGAKGSAEVTRKSKFLSVAPGKVTTNLKGDYSKFVSLAEELGGRYLEQHGVQNGSKIGDAITKMSKAKTLKEARAIVDTIKYQPHASAKIVVKDNDKLTIKRSDVTLGGYALVEMVYKTTGGDSLHEIRSDVQAISKNRIELKQISGETSKTEFTATMTPAQGADLLKDALKLCDMLGNLNRRLSGLSRLSQFLKNHLAAPSVAVGVTADNTDFEAQKGMPVIIREMALALTTASSNVARLGGQIPTASVNMINEAIAIAKQIKSKASE